MVLEGETEKGNRMGGVTMKKLFAGAALATAVAIGGPAMAADMPVKAAPVAPVWSWTGCYAGMDVGYTSARFRESNVTSVGIPPVVPINTTFANFNFSGDGMSGGGQIGCNLQNGAFVWGVETDIQGLSGGGQKLFTASIFEFPQAGAFSTDVRSTLRYFGTVRGRVGWTATPTTLLYVTGGFAYARVNSGLCFSPTASGLCGAFGTDDTHNHTGYTVGVGGETKVAQNWSAKLEYLYANLGSQTYNFLNIAGINYQWNERVDIHTVRLGVNYRFY